MPERLAKRLLIVGWDAADWKIIDTLFANGAMPTLRRLVEQGVRANLASLEPRLSPLLWTAIATGKTADKHGILNFVEPDPSGEGLRIISSTSRKTKALWNILTQSGRRTNVVGWYASHPAEPISGVCVSNLFQEGIPASPDGPWTLLNGAVHPPELAEQIAELRMHPANVQLQQLAPLLPRLHEISRSDERRNILARELAHCASVHNVATAILADDTAWDCTMVFYDAIDTVGHNFMQYHPPRMDHVSERDFELYRDVMFGLYQFHDMMLGRLLDLAGPETTVILLSDHGFYSDHRRPVIKDLSNEQRALLEASWHRPLGVLAMAGPGIKRAQRIYGASLLDITPTALALLGLPVGADMTGRALAESFDRPAAVESIFSWDLQEGDAGLHPSDVRQDPFEAQDAINQLIDLGYMAALPADAKAKHDLAWRETQCNLGTVYTTSGRSDQAIVVFEELTKRYPQERRYVFGLARALYASLRYEQCAAAIRRFLEQDSSNVEARIMLAMALAAADRGDEAAEVLAQLEREHGSRIELANAFGDVYIALQRWDEADSHYRRALESDPDSALVHHGLARAAVGREKFEEAVEHCLRAVELVHVFPDAHHTLGVALTWMKDYDHAIKAFNVAISMRPGLLDSHRYLASIYRHVGDRENAAKHRRVVERLLGERGTGATSIDFLKKEAPLGPQEWARRMGLGPQVPTSG
jgi:predicted AlkP superfamily phosphohydrolase/phosphomutase/tetratricopeptide (TPR) repeat protein